MNRGFRTLAAIALAAAACLAPLARAQQAQPTVEEILTQGLSRMTREALLHAFGVRVGDPYDPRKIREEFRKLWSLGIFSDISVEAEDGPGGGKVLVLKVKERPVLTSVSYEENKVLTRTQIEDRLKERKVKLEPGKPLDLKAVFEAESAIREYLGEKGYLDPQVSHRVDRPTDTTAAVSFSLRPGGKTRISSIRFVGNTVFSQRRLMKSLKLTRPRQWWRPWSSKSLYHPAKWDMDANNIRDLYENRGYLDVDLRPPVVDVTETVKGGKKPPVGEVPAGGTGTTPAAAAPGGSDVPPEPQPPLTEKQKKEQEKAKKKAEKERKKAEPKVERRVALTVPVVEGPEYRAGKISVTGNTVFREQDVLAFVPLRSGDVVNIGLLKLSVDAITKAYGNKGYYLATAVQQRDRHPDKKLADIQIVVTEDKPYYVSRIEFTGNVVTRDRVLRREFPIREGDLFNRSLLDIGLSKVNQLGYFESKAQPVIEPIEGENRVRVSVEGEEKSRNEIQVGGGYSGLDGMFFQGMFSTRNFLGRGQTVSLSAQIGGRATRYSISFVEPWLFNRPYNAGFSLYRQDVDYGSGLKNSSSGGGVVIGRQIGYYSRVQGNYNYQVSTATNFTVSGGASTVYVSSITPSFSHFRINNPYRPSRGWSVDLGLQLAGEFLGGDSSFYRPVLNYSGYKRAVRNTFFGFHSEIGMIHAWGTGVPSTADVNGVPRFSRFWIGGDTQGPRIFDVRSVTPLRFVRLDSTGRIIEAVRDPRGRPVRDFDRNGDGILNIYDLVEMGGDRYYLMQAEYVVPLSGPVEAAFFLDVGNSLFEDTPWSFQEVRASAGIEMRFYLPVFPVPLRLMYGWPIRQLIQDRTSNFMFSIGKSF